MRDLSCLHSAVGLALKELEVVLFSEAQHSGCSSLLAMGKQLPHSQAAAPDRLS
jgi:hypothetical protein